MLNRNMENQKLTTPISIIIAGVIIAGAVIYSQSPKQLAQQDNRPEPIVEEKNVNINIKDWPSKGNPNALVLMVEYSDFACPFCARFWQETLPQIEKEYINTGKVRFVYKDFVVVGGDRAAEAAHCAAEQGKFWEYHDLLFSKTSEDRGKWSDSNIHREYAQKLGINANDLVKCFEARRYQDKVAGSTQEGAENGATGTPTIFINGKMITGAQPFSAFKAMIDEELKKLEK